MAVVFVFGAIIGSFLNVVSYRFHTGKSLGGHSHCLSCATPLQWYELFPLFSYLALRGHCRSCGCYIPARYFWVELTTGALFVAGFWSVLNGSGGEYAINSWSLGLLWVALSIMVVIVVYDLYHFIIPDALVAWLTLVVVGKAIAELITLPTISATLLISWLGTALLGSGFFLFLWLISKGTWLGFGDVKLAFPLGLLVGAERVFSLVVLSFWIGATVSLLLIALQRLTRGKPPLHLLTGSLTIKSAVPFAPFLVASALVIIFTDFNVLSLFSSLKI